MHLRNIAETSALKTCKDHCSNSFHVFLYFFTQNTVTILCIRYSRLRIDENDEPLTQSHQESFESVLDNEEKPDGYFVSSLVFAVEAIKLLFVIVLLVAVQTQCSVRKTMELVYSDVICRPYDTLRLSIPSILYVIQDNLIIFALSCLDAGTYQVEICV